MPPMYARVWKQQSMDRPGETNLISPSALYSRSVLPFFPASFICSCTFSCSKFRRKKPYDRRICLEKFQKLSKFCAGLLPCLFESSVISLADCPNEDVFGSVFHVEIPKSGYDSPGTPVPEPGWHPYTGQPYAL